MDQLQGLLERLWEDYQQLTPDASRIHQLLADRGEIIRNDHIAFRTFDHPKINLDKVADPFLRSGYHPGDSYTFPEKKLNARHLEPPDPALPKVFVSELKTGEFSEQLRRTVQELVERVPDELPGQLDFPVSKRLWPIAYSTYQALGKESEYAAWVAAFGFRANHFTISVNALKQFDDLAAFNAFLKEKGFQLNASGGEIKGSPEVYLEQSSTLAREVPVAFTEGNYPVPGCYYEFARRYPLPNGELFQGFVARSADKIFESTDRRHG